MTKKGFTLIELLVVIAIIALLLSIVMPSLRKVKETAKAVICNSNMHQWGIIFNMYTEDHKGKFHHGWINGLDGSGMWSAVLRPYYSDPKIMSCPNTSLDNTDGTHSMWGPFRVTSSWTDALEGDYGSYGTNEYVCDREDDFGGNGGVNGENNWKKTGQKNAFNIPVFAECWWIGATPGDNDTPPSYAGERLSSQSDNSLARFCIDRHRGYVNVLFMDWSSRKVGLKELWTLKWHQTFDTSNYLTLAGNGGNAAATAAKWDQAAPWMSEYPEY